MRTSVLDRSQQEGWPNATGEALNTAYFTICTEMNEIRVDGFRLDICIII